MSDSRWISVHLLSGRVENHPGVVSIDCEADLTLHFENSYVTYKELVWDYWHVTTPAEIFEAAPRG